MLVSASWSNLSGEDIDLKVHEGFVYCLTNKATGQLYIGRKYFHSISKRKVPGRKNRKITKKESDWKDYYGSSDIVKQMINKFGKELFQRDILSLHKTRGAANFEEISQQFKRDVLTAQCQNGHKIYYNRNILSRYFQRDPCSFECSAKQVSIALNEGFSLT